MLKLGKLIKIMFVARFLLLLLPVNTHKTECLP